MKFWLLFSYIFQECITTALTKKIKQSNKIEQFRPYYTRKGHI